MKKTISIVLLLFGLSLNIFAETASSSLGLSAYKIAPLPSLSYTISIKDYTNSSSGSEISGVTKVYDITNSIKSSRTISKAFSISISSNLKASINIGIKFTPFVNQNDQSITMPVTYSFSSTDLNAVVGSTFCEKNYTYYQYYSSYTCYFAKYTPSFKINSSSTGSFYVSQDSSYTLIFNPGEKIETYTEENWCQTPGENWGGWVETNTMPSTTSDTLPGFVDGQVISGTANFGISIAEADYAAMRANADYVTMVTVTISTV